MPFSKGPMAKNLAGSRVDGGSEAGRTLTGRRVERSVGIKQANRTVAMGRKIGAILQASGVAHVDAAAAARTMMSSTLTFLRMKKN